MLISGVTNLLVITQASAPSPALFWFASVSLVVAVCLGANKPTLKLSLPQAIALALLLLLPVALRFWSRLPLPGHRDEFILGYFSDYFSLLRQNFFGGYPVERSEWVSQYPSPYFAIQKLFFLVLGPTVSAIHLTMLPYRIVTALFIFLLGKRLCGTSCAVVSVLIYACLAPSRYLESFSIINDGATAALTMLLYYCTGYLDETSREDALMIGVLSGFSCLFYVGGFVCIPLAIITHLLTVRRP